MVRPNSSNALPKRLEYKYRTVSISHLDALQEDVDTLKNEGKLSDNATYRSYLQDLKFEIPEKLPDAKSLIIIAVASKLMLVKFHFNGRMHDVQLPSNYHKLSDEALQKTVLNHIVRKPCYKSQRTTELHLKLLAVRSGLAKYGRNNLCYVEGMGSLLRLAAYFTNCEFEDNWNDITLMEICRNCKACMNNCPNHCITEENFVINAGRCLSLYNEIEGEFPEWISPTAHNALMGCMKCQSICPANREALTENKRLEDITEEETNGILKGRPNQELLRSLSKKLGSIYPIRSPQSFQILTRNLKALIEITETEP